MFRILEWSKPIKILVVKGIVKSKRLWSPGGGTQNIFYYLAGKFLKIICCLYSTIGLTKPNFDIKPKYLPEPDPNVPYTLHLKRQTYRMKIDIVKERKKTRERGYIIAYRIVVHGIKAHKNIDLPFLHFYCR